jgi:hypothetical protein
MHHHGSTRELWAGGVGLGGGRSSAVVARDGGTIAEEAPRRLDPGVQPSRGQDPDLWTCPVNPHLMHIGCNIYLFIYLIIYLFIYHHSDVTQHDTDWAAAATQRLFRRGGNSAACLVACSFARIKADGGRPHKRLTIPCTKLCSGEFITSPPC